eukprot:TRINITY_DN1394_c0_g1_i1.p1 TRINITY_DN1394_c0_g1~~TRINITY_DN1394_c0_g1_i1.p1  ORF type:complete len:239 (+),score=21.08 TRINITY_DN1394_c0_g1_i1:390-1106(+)
MDPLARALNEGTEAEPVRKTAPTIHDDYLMFFPFDDAALESGICPGLGPFPVQDTSQSGDVAGSSSPYAGPSEQSGQGKKKSRRGGKAHKKTSGLTSDEPGSDSPFALRPGSLPLLEPSSLSLSRPASGTALVDLGESSIVPLPDPPLLRSLSGSPGPSSLPEAGVSPRPKVVLSQRDKDKLRRAFEEGKQRRAEGTNYREQHVAKIPDESFILSPATHMKLRDVLQEFVPSSVILES